MIISSTKYKVQSTKIDTQRISALMNARQQRSADRAVQPRTVKGALQLLTQQSQRVTAELLALLVSSQLRQKGAENA